MDLEGIRLSEIGQRKTNAILFHLHVQYKNQNKQLKRNRLINIDNRLLVTIGDGVGVG